MRTKALAKALHLALPSNARAVTINTDTQKLSRASQDDSVVSPRGYYAENSSRKLTPTEYRSSIYKNRLRGQKMV